MFFSAYVFFVKYLIIQYYEMSVFKATIFILLLFVAVQISLQDVVDPHLACAEMGKYYGQGCSGLTAKLLGKP